MNAIPRPMLHAPSIPPMYVRLQLAVERRQNALERRKHRLWTIALLVLCVGLYVAADLTMPDGWIAKVVLP